MTNATFLEHDYMIVFKPRSKVLEKLLSNKSGPLPTRVVETLTSKTTIPNQTLVAPR